VALSTPRLVLRPFTPGDVDDLLSMDGDARVMRYIGTGLGPRTRDEVTASIGRIVAFAAEHPGMSLLHASTRDEGRFVGGCGLFPLPEGGDVGVTFPDNAASQQVLRKIGMREDGQAEHYGRTMQMFVADAPAQDVP